MAVVDEKTQQLILELFKDKKRPLEKEEIASFLASRSQPLSSSSLGRKRKAPVVERETDISKDLEGLCSCGVLCVKELRFEGGNKMVYFPGSSSSSSSSSSSLRREEIERRDMEKKLEKYKTQEFEDKKKKYIDELHRYNETKDTAQAVMGQIAVMEKKTIKEVHEDFGVHGEL